jgi:hypothetical protein
VSSDVLRSAKDLKYHIYDTHSKVPALPILRPDVNPYPILLFNHEFFQIISLTSETYNKRGLCGVVVFLFFFPWLPITWRQKLASKSSMTLVDLFMIDSFIKTSFTIGYFPHLSVSLVLALSRSVTSIWYCFKKLIQDKL